MSRASYKWSEGHYIKPIATAFITEVAKLPPSLRAGSTRSAAVVAQKRREYRLGLPLRHFALLHGDTPPECSHFMRLAPPFAQGAFGNPGITAGSDHIILVGFENLEHECFVIGRVASRHAIVSIKKSTEFRVESAECKQKAKASIQKYKAVMWMISPRNVEFVENVENGNPQKFPISPIV